MTSTSNYLEDFAKIRAYFNHTSQHPTALNVTGVRSVGLSFA
jgi:hypothetical protein